MRYVDNNQTEFGLKIKFKMTLTMCILFAVILSACETNSVQSAGQMTAKPVLQFVDLSGFDRDLSVSLSAPLPRVEVAFYDRITPSAVPERLQHWMAAVELGGGSVKVVPPKSSVTAKSPFLLISLANSLWSASKIAKDVSVKAQFNSAKAFDAEIMLKVDDKGESVVDKVVFIQRLK
jgi:hypothetical protein